MVYMSGKKSTDIKFNLFFLFVHGDINIHIKFLVCDIMTHILPVLMYPLIKSGIACFKNCFRMGTLCCSTTQVSYITRTQYAGSKNPFH